MLATAEASYWSPVSTFIVLTTAEASYWSPVSTFFVLASAEASYCSPVSTFIVLTTAEASYCSPVSTFFVLATAEASYCSPVSTFFVLATAEASYYKKKPRTIRGLVSNRYTYINGMLGSDIADIAGFADSVDSCEEMSLLYDPASLAPDRSRSDS